MNKKPILYVLIDSECLICSKFAAFCINQEYNCTFFFSDLKSEFTSNLSKDNQFLLGHNAIVCFDPEKKMFFEKSDAIIRIFSSLKFPFNTARLIKVSPTFLRDKMYGFVSKRRYLFGKNTCSIDSLKHRERFIR